VERIRAALNTPQVSASHWTIGHATNTRPESARRVTPNQPHRFCIAPMMDWTDRHCRFFHRLLTRRALIYTEMVTTGAVLHGDRARRM
jgi:hypothetical protein